MSDSLTRRTLLTTSAGVALTLAVPSVGSAAPRAERIAGPWSEFGTVTGPDHALWRDILSAHARQGSDGITRFDYGAVRLDALDAYISVLSQTDPRTLTQEAAFAYWVNAYNAVTVRVVADAFPVRSIRDIGGSLFAPGPWREPLFDVLGYQLSLDDIEHGILRPVFRDPRIHYAVNCASIGCPNLKRTPWTAETLGADLASAAAQYVNHPRGVQITGDRLIVSRIYDWFQSDFGSDDAAVIAHLRVHARPDLDQALSTRRTIAGYEYDWGVNSV